MFVMITTSGGDNIGVLLKGYVFRIYPNSIQKQLIEKSFGVSRFIYTYFLNKKIIKLPKLKEIKIRGYRNLKSIKGRIVNATIYKEVNKYYVSICAEENINIPTIIPRLIVGIDLGIKDLLTTSDGMRVENKEYIEKYEKKIKGLNRWLTRTQKGIKNREKIM